MSACVNGWKKLRRLLWRHPDPGIADRKFKLNFFARAFQKLDIEPDLAALGELHGVVHKIGEDLAETQRVAEQHVRNAGRDVRKELEAFIVGFLSSERGDRSNDFIGLKSVVSRSSLPASIFEKSRMSLMMGQQRGAGIMNLADVKSRCFGFSGVFRARCERADDGVSSECGFRWLMFARNMDFICVASSALALLL